MIDGRKLFIDASFIDADASNKSVVDMKRLDTYVNKSYRHLEERLDALQEQKTTPANERFVSTTDPDASVSRYGKSKSKLRYKTHRSVDEKHEVITGTKVTPGSVDDGAVLEEMTDLHEHNTLKKIDTLVADTKYGTVDNYLNCHDKGIRTHIPSIEESHRGSGRRKGIFSKQAFTYHPDTDTYICPAGNVLIKQKFKKKRKHFEYKATAKVCNKCDFRDQCTRSKFGRTLKRHARQDELDAIVERTKSRECKKDLKTRHHLSERSFAQSTHYGFNRARWRTLWRMEIQDFLIAAIQNIKVLIKQPKPRMSKSDIKECRRIGFQSLQWLRDWVDKRVMLVSRDFLLLNFSNSYN